MYSPSGGLQWRYLALTRSSRFELSNMSCWFLVVVFMWVVFLSLQVVFLLAPLYLNPPTHPFLFSKIHGIFAFSFRDKHNGQQGEGVVSSSARLWSATRAATR
jgi:hypothetical protein